MDFPQIPIYHVDAFTDRPFSGNPAAVCILTADAPEQWMQSVASEMNLAETAFLSPHRGTDPGNTDGFNLRWFTPKQEVDLCGHATLAGAHVLWETGRLDPEDRAHFQTRSGLLSCLRRADQIELDFPAERDEPCSTPDGLGEALGADILYCGRNRFDLLVEVNDSATLVSLQPDLRRLAGYPVRGIIVTCLSDQAEFDFLSRFFAPGVGIDEDPVTGSAHCCLGPFWQRRLNRVEMRGCQVSERGGIVGTRMEGDRVILTGKAVTVLSGTLTLAQA